MGVIAFTAEAYSRVMKALLPPGRLWDTSAGSVLSLIFLAAGDELARVSGRAVDIVEEADSETTNELIEDFERELALTDTTGSDAERRLRIVAKETKEPSFRTHDVQAALAPYLAQDAVDVVVIENTRADAIAVGVDEEIYRFYVHRDPLESGTADIAAAQTELDVISHSHTKGTVIESIAMICDDQYSLCDRDVLGI